MNKLNIASTGYPGTTESWKFLNTMIQELAEAVALQVTDQVVPVIIYGMGNGGSGTILPGFFIWKGELYRFEGGQPQDYVCIIEDVENATYNTDMANSGQLADFPTYYKRYARFGGNNEGIDRFLFSEMKRMKDLFEISEKVNPATEDSAGIVEIATQAEVDAGVDDSKAITPLKLSLFGCEQIIQEGSMVETINDNSQTEQLRIFFIDLGSLNSPVKVKITPIVTNVLNQANINQINWYLIDNAGGYKLKIMVKYSGTGNGNYTFDLKINWALLK